MIRPLNRRAGLPHLLLTPSSKQQIQLLRFAAVDKVNPNQGIVTTMGLVGTLSTPEAPTLSTM